MVVKHVSFAEAEDLDNKYWKNASIEERLNMIYTLRGTIAGKNGRVKKVANKRRLNEEN